MKITMLLLFAVLFIATYSQSNSAIFALSWYEGHCMNIANTGGCDAAQLSRWDHQSFTIHGLWASTTSEKYYGDFDYSIIREDSQLLDDMNNYWPPQSRSTGSPTFLWQHEWNQHGQDYAEIIYRVQPQRFNGLRGTALKRKLQSAYFHDIVAFYKKYQGLQKYPFSELSKDNFARRLGISSNEFTLSCTDGNLIREVKMCLNVTPTGNQLTTCTSQANTQCKYGVQYELPAWRRSNQKRVIR